MSREAKYAVKFVGYSAIVIAAKHGREVECATLDFVSGAAAILADGGCVLSEARINLRPFFSTLPKLANEIQFVQRSRDCKLSYQTVLHAKRSAPAVDMITLSFGSNIVSIASDTDVPRFIRAVMKRFNEIECILEQAENLGSRLTRRPYCEYIDEIAKTGISRVESHGYGLFVDGKLIFHPNYQIAIVKKASETGFEVHL